MLRRSFLQIAVMTPVPWLLPAAALAQTSPLVRLSFSSGWDALPALIAIERGFFHQQGLVVSGLAVSSAEAVINSLAAGSTDMAVVPQRVLMVMAAAKVQVKVVGVAGWGTENQLVASAKSGIGGLADIKGKRVAVLTGSDSFPALMRLLNRQRLRPQDVKVVQLPANDLTQAFDKNLADAMFETRHFTDAATARGRGKVIAGAADITQAIGWIGAMPLVARSAAIEKESDNVQKVVNGFVRSLRYIEQDPEDSARILTIFFHRQGVKVTPDMARSWIALTKHNQYVWSPQATADAEYNGWGLNVGGILKVAPKLDGMVDNRFAERAAKEIAGAR